MNYIFFDIECANCQGGRAKICSFGYVITNEYFKVVEKRDLIINPRAPFMLNGRGNRPYIKLAYDKKQFLAAPDFRAALPKIRELLSSRNCLIFGYAADNDASYLKSEFERYKLPCVDFIYYDLQKLFRFALPERGQNQVSLAGAASLFIGEVDQEIHKSDEDAYLTMRVLEGLSKKTGLSPVKLLEQYPACRGELKDLQVYICIPEGKNLFVRPLGDKSDRIAPKTENRTLYTRFIRHVKPSGAVRPQWLRGKRVSVPEKFAERHYSDAMKLIQLICDCGGRYTQVADDCHVFVTFPVYNDDGSEKEAAEIARIKGKRPVCRTKFLSPDQFFAECGLDPEEGAAALPFPSVRHLLDERYAQNYNPKNKSARRTPPVKKDRTVTIIPPED